MYNLNFIPNQVWEHGYFWEWLGVTRDTKVAFGKFPYFPYHTETFWYGMVWEWYGKRIRFPIPYHTVVRHNSVYLGKFASYKPCLIAFNRPIDIKLNYKELFSSD